eukprot:3226702-Rhodomonas_salina.2
MQPARSQVDTRGAFEPQQAPHARHGHQRQALRGEGPAHLLWFATCIWFFLDGNIAAIGRAAAATLG